MTNESLSKQKLGPEVADRVLDVLKVDDLLVEARSDADERPQVFDIFQGRRKGSVALRRDSEATGRESRLPRQRYACERHREMKEDRLKSCSEEERKVILRAERLEWFMTQPFGVMAEPTGKAGVVVPVEQTLEGCRRILDGELDQAVAADVMYRGALA